MHLGITEKPSRICILNILSTFSEQTASENDENYRLRQTQCRLTPLPEKPPANIGICLIFLETRIIGLHFPADKLGLSLFKFF